MWRDALLEAISLVDRTRNADQRNTYAAPADPSELSASLPLMPVAALSSAGAVTNASPESKLEALR